jgi:hypothetical protein
MAAFFDRSMSLVAEDEDACRDFDDVVGDGSELIVEYPLGLRREAFEEEEVAVGYSLD